MEIGGQGSRRLSLACFRSVPTAGCSQEAIVSGGQHPNDLAQFRWINTLLGNLQTSFRSRFHTFTCDKYARRYLGGSCFRCNRRLSLATKVEQIANAVCCCTPGIKRSLRAAEAYG